MATPKPKLNEDVGKLTSKTGSFSKLLEKTWQREVVRIDSRYEELHQIPDREIPNTTSSAAPFIGVGVAMVLGFTVAILLLIFHYKNPERNCWKKRRNLSPIYIKGDEGKTVTAVNYNFVHPHMHTAVNNCFVQEGMNGGAWIGQCPWIGIAPDSITVEMSEYGTTVDGRGHSNFSYTTDDESYGIDSDKSYRVDNDRCYPYYYTGPSCATKPSEPVPTGAKRKH